jgi:cytochrome d ubiquinol oxidase subunit I
VLRREQPEPCLAVGTFSGLDEVDVRAELLFCALSAAIRAVVERLVATTANVEYDADVESATARWGRGRCGMHEHERDVGEEEHPDEEEQRPHEQKLARCSCTGKHAAVFPAGCATLPVLRQFVMHDLLAARSQMGMSLAFHIIFAVVGIGMPALMVIAEYRWRRTGDAGYLELAKRWARGTAILFAVGAVSGTVLSFELGLLWPEFMKQAGAIIGMPFSLEGFAFFTEAIFLGVYLYGWDRISPRAHVLAGVMVAVSGALSGIFVVIANAWMNTPRGFTLLDGKFTNVDPIAAMMTPAAFPQTLHMTLAAYAATGFAVAGIHAAMLLRDPRNAFHRRALGIALLVGAPAALIQPLAGDVEARYVARQQPAKLAAMEGLFQTTRGAPLSVGGIANENEMRTRYAIEIPHGLSLLAFHELDAEVKGLDAFPRDQWPPVAFVHLAFDVMVGLGSFLALVSAVVLIMLWRKRDIVSLRWLLIAVMLCAPMGFLCIEAGWMVTEIGRQPWIIYGILRTADAVTPMPGLIVPFLTFTALYCFLGVIVVLLLYQQVLRSPREDEQFPQQAKSA